MKSIFRQEAFDHQRERLSGDVIIAIPPSWQSLGVLFFVSVAAVLAFLAWADYSRTETVGGTIVPDLGVASVVPTRPGVISHIEVRDGDVVSQGDRLFSVRSEADSADGIPTSAKVEAAVEKQDSGLATQMAETSAAFNLQLSQIEIQIAGLRSEIGQIDSQIALQESMVKIAEADLEKARTIASRGFISERDINNRTEGVLIRRQSLIQLSQSLVNKKSTLDGLIRSTAQSRHQNRAQLSALTAARAEVAQNAAGVSGSRSYVSRAPVSGQVTAIVVRSGQPVDGQAAVMSIVPSGSQLQAELMIPPSAIGFVKPGQEVRLAIEAFPYQKFGTITGVIVTVPSSPTLLRSATGATTAYPVVATLSDRSIKAFGRSQQLLPGMTLSARIVLQRQSLLQWLFEPLFALDER